MAKRWPPILGVTGFDGGSKSAIALATRTGKLQGGEGEQVPGRGPGACCYPDGSCDELSEFDCVSSGGEWQGAGVPCDPNPCPSTECPETITITFTGVTFSCGCLPHDGISSTFEDTCPDHGGFPTFNNTPLELSLQTPCEGFDCWWLGGSLCVVEVVYTTADCSDPVSDYFPFGIQVVVGRVGSTWYVFAEFGEVFLVVFEGSGTDPSLIDNSAPCTLPNKVDWSSPLIDCPGGWSNNAYGIATGGTATIT